VVVSDLDEIKVRPFPASPRDHLPDALADMGALIERLADRSPAVFLDYDGTLTPIVAHPDLAVLSETTRAVITELASLTTVAVLSGRDVADVRDKMGVKGIYYAGSHGFDILGPDGEPVAGERLREIDRYLAPLEEAGELLERRLGGIDGSQVERKRYAIAVHFRRVEGDDVSLVEKAVHEIAPHFPQLRVGTGKKVLELRPDFDWDKGRALNWLLSELGLDNPDITPVYLGDDTTDEDAFRAIRRRGIGIVVGQDGESTHAQWMLETTDDVRSFLAALADRERNR
jgi:alpha,alpha-trehalase